MTENRRRARRPFHSLINFYGRSFPVFGAPCGSSFGAECRDTQIPDVGVQLSESLLRKRIRCSHFELEAVHGGKRTFNRGVPRFFERNQCILNQINPMADQRDMIPGSHCEVDRGCRVYAERPQTCRTFYCNYMLVAALGDEWKPRRSKMILVTELGGRRLTVYVDPHRPDAWKTEPYRSQLKEWAITAAREEVQLLVCIGRRMHAIFPDRDVDLGLVQEDEVIVTGRRRTPWGIEMDALKLHKDDPRVRELSNAGMRAGAVRPGRA